MLERKFSSQFRKELVSVNGGVCTLMQDAPMSGKKPYDAFYLRDLMYVAIEFKVVKGGTFPYKDLVEHQRESLRRVSEEKHQAMIVVLFEKFKTVVCMDYMVFINELHRKTRSDTSMSYKYLEELGHDEHRPVHLVTREKVHHQVGDFTKTAWNTKRWVDNMAYNHYLLMEERVC